MITELHYSSTNTYLISGTKGLLLFDTGWAGTFRSFCREMGQLGIPVQKISYILISHFHPDHCGIAQEIADLGAVIAAVDVQRDYVHAADDVLKRESEKGFHPIDDQRIRMIDCGSSRSFLQEMGIAGEIIPTPGHSDDSISLCLDDGSFFVGDLNPLYELAMHRGTTIGNSWERLLSRHPKTIYYGHARTADLDPPEGQQDAGQVPAQRQALFVEAGQPLPDAQPGRRRGADGKDHPIHLFHRIQSSSLKKCKDDYSTRFCICLPYPS